MKKILKDLDVRIGKYKSIPFSISWFLILGFQGLILMGSLILVYLTIILI